MQIKPFFKGAFKTTSVWSLLFVAGLIGFNALVFWSWHGTEAYRKPVIWNLGGPVPKSEAERSSLTGDAIYPGGETASTGGEILLVMDTAVGSASDPLTNLISLGDGLKKYKIKKGDTFANLATRFNISVDTLKWANPGVRSLKPGDTLTILPVSGVLYNFSKNDSLEIIASRYQTDVELIKTYNPNYQRTLSDGNGYLILPYAKPAASRVEAVPGAGNLPDLKDYFALPAIGWNWGQLHNYNAVDIANQCGTSVHAAAEGLVVSDQNFGDGSSGWNDGYGIFVLLEHPNGTKTRYAHLDKTLVKAGDYVSRGQEVGVMGNTGNTHGPTGCHLHFEIYGAKNPFAITK